MMRMLMDQKSCFLNDLKKKCKMDPCLDVPFFSPLIKEEKEECIEMMSSLGCLLVTLTAYWMCLKFRLKNLSL